MSDTCERCGRLVATTADDHDPVATCWHSDAGTCPIARTAYLRGLREGVEMARAKAIAFCEDCRWKSNEEIDWSEVEAEIERRAR